MADCLACDLMSGRKHLPGGQIWGDPNWFVDHCIGPLGLGTMVVLPVRHMLHVADLTSEEAEALGGILRTATQVATELMQPEQVYISLWSHAGATPGHIHFVVQPITRETMSRFGGRHGPSLQVEMFATGVPERDEAVEEFAIAARQRFAQHLGEATWHGPFSATA